MKISRNKIINTLEAGFINNPVVYAFWLEGADAMNSVDKYSDIDIWLDVEDGQEGNILKEIKKILTLLAEIDFEHEEDHPHPKIRQKFFHLKSTSEFLIIDVCIQSHSRKLIFTKGNNGDAVKIVFDKDNTLKFTDFDEQKLKKNIIKRLQYLKKTFYFFQAWVKKEIKRKNLLEACDGYQTKIMEPLVEMVRINYRPTKSYFFLKHISKDLPKKVVAELEVLMLIGSLEDMSFKVEKANELFEKYLKEAEKKYF